jgi:hypothetical protein
MSVIRSSILPLTIFLVPALAIGGIFGPSVANLLRVPHPGNDESENPESEITYVWEYIFS